MHILVYVVIVVLSLLIGVMLQQYVIWPLLRRVTQQTEMPSVKATSMTATQLHIKISLLVLLSAIGGAAIAAPLFSLLGSGKIDMIRHPAVISMLVFGSLLFASCIVLAGRIASKVMPGNSTASRQPDN